jgi:pimeloyl-ACP methyl ester carboxylesterase
MIATNEERVRSAVTLGAPTMKRADHRQLEFALPFFTAALKLVPYWWGYKRIAQLGSYAMNLSGPLLARVLFTLENCEVEHLGPIGRCAIDDVPSGVTLQMLDWYRERRMTTHYGTLDPVDALERTRTPLLVVCGSKDRLTPLEDVRVAYDRSGADSKELLVCGREHGFSADYGHIDLVFGRRAREEVFPRLRDWLRKHDEPVRGVRNGAPASRSRV